MQHRRLSNVIGPISLVLLVALFHSTAHAKPANGKGGGSEPSAPPYLAFSADRSVVQPGESVLLSWASDNSRHCFASGAWSGKLATEGIYRTEPLYGPASYTLECKDGGASAIATVEVSVDTGDVVEPAPTPEPTPEPAPAPTLTLSASEPVVASGDTVDLSWTSTHADVCSASGGWTGDKPINGTESVGPLSQSTTYGLSCSGVGGSAVAMISVAINESVTLTWMAPTQNVDGTALTDLAGYRIYYGAASGAYTDVLEVTSSSSTSHSLTLPSGSYYFAMTAVDASGNESAYSNELMKSIN